MLIDLLLRQIHRCINFVPNRFLGGERQSQVDAVQGHPVDIFLPLRPLPPGRAVPGCTHILVVPKPGFFHLFSLKIRCYGKIIRS